MKRKVERVEGKVVSIECTRCASMKLPGDFGRDSRNAIGRQSWCKRCIAARNTARYHEDPKARRRKNETAAAWRKRNPEKERAWGAESARQYRKRHPDRIAARGQAGYWLRDKVLAVFNRCMACGTKDDLTIDHVIALGQVGSTNDPSNLQVLCRSCNSTKGDQTIDYRTREQRELLTKLT